MQVKRERSHQCGLSNIDFRRLSDANSITKYYNDMRRSDFGLMGRTHIPYSYQSCDFGNCQSLLIHSGFKIPEPPNPRYAETQRYYEGVKKPFLLPSSIQKKRVTHLEDYVWDEKVFTGEDVKQKNWYKSKVPLDKNLTQDLLNSTNNKTISIDYINSIEVPKKGDKLDKHEKALQETQLVKVMNKETLEGMVDIQKVKEIRRALRRRYGNRLNYHKIFNAWDRDRKGYLNLDDIHYMINSMGISINIQEARVLLASHDHEGKQKLSMEEFMDLIFSTNDNMNVDLSKIKLTTDPGEIIANESIMQGIQNDAAKLKKIKNEKIFKYVLQKSLKELFKEFKEGDVEKTEKINYEQFIKAIKDKVQLPEYIKENETLFIDLYSDQEMNEEGEINYQKFCEGIRNFRYMGETDINIDLGEGKAVAIMGEVKRDVSKPEDHLHIFDIQKVPANQLEKIFNRTLKVSRMLQAKYKSKDNLDKDLKAQLKFDQYGNVTSNDFEKYMLSICQEQLNKRELSRKDLEGFMSAFKYNIYKTMDINGIAPLVFSDDTQISAKIYSLQRAMPPPSKIAEKELPKTESKADVDDSRMREIVKELQVKSFEDKKYIYSVYKDYDRDGDGYISYDDIRQQFKNLKVSATDEEVNRFIELTDPSKKGYLNFGSFSSVISPNMAESLTPLPKTEENFFFRRERSNLVPNRLKVEENIEYHKSFNSKFFEIRDKLLPDKNALISNLLYEYLDPTPSTRFGAKPEPFNTFLNFQPTATSGMYISEQVWCNIKLATVP